MSKNIFGNIVYREEFAIRKTSFVIRVFWTFNIEGYYIVNLEGSKSLPRAWGRNEEGSNDIAYSNPP